MDAFQRLEARFEGMEEVIASLTRKVGELEDRVCHCHDSDSSKTTTDNGDDDNDNDRRDEPGESEAIRELRAATGLSGPVAMVQDPETGALVPVEIQEDFYGGVTDRAEPLPVVVRDPPVPVSRQCAVRRSGPLSNLGPTHIGRKSCRNQHKAVNEYFNVA